MKRTTIHISAALALLLGIAACTQDEAGFLPEGAEGTPIVFTATGLNPAATADNTSATLTSDEPYYWTNHDDITVTAWWPYTAGETTPPAVKVAADQSARKDFEGTDGELRQPHTPLHPPHGAGHRHPDGLHRGDGVRQVDRPLHRERQPRPNHPV